MPLPELSGIEPTLREAARNELRAGEHVVWARQPIPRGLVGRTARTVLFAIPWTAFSVAWTVGMFRSTRGGGGGGGAWTWLFPLWGVPFVLIGLGMFCAPLWRRRELRRTVYLVTDRRAIILRRKSFGSLLAMSFEPDRLTQIERTERRDGSGDLIFETFVEPHGSGTRTVRRGFESVAGVREVEELLLRTLFKDRTRPLA